MSNAKYRALLDLWKEIKHFSFFQGLASWDRECVMPKAASKQRTEHMVFLSERIHALESSDSYADALSEAESVSEDLEPNELSNVQLLRRRFNQNAQLSAEWVSQWAAQRGANGQAWQEARSKKDFSIFQKDLEKTANMMREKADMLGYQDEAYDALHDCFEIGSTTAAVKRLFANLGPACSDLLREVREQGAGIAIAGPFSEECQKAITDPILNSMGFDQERGMLATTVHPFCSRIDGDDTRLAIRYEPDNIFQYIGALMHEAGHGLYSQGLPNKWLGTPVGDAVSLAIHESQSRLWECAVGRSEAYAKWLLPVLQKHVSQFEDVDLPTYMAARNNINDCRIRIESDEISYNLHILLRFEIEQAIISGALEVKDVPGEWNKRFEELFGYPVRDDAEGCLQDVHWSMGAFGYFPTYTMGNCYAAQFFYYAKRQLSSLDKDISQGDCSKLKKWLTKNIHQHGSRYQPDELCLKVTNENLNPTYLLNSLRERYLKK